MERQSDCRSQNERRLTQSVRPILTDAHFSGISGAAKTSSVARQRGKKTGRLNDLLSRVQRIDDASAAKFEQSAEFEHAIRELRSQGI